MKTLAELGFLVLSGVVLVIIVILRQQPPEESISALWRDLEEVDSI